MMEAATDTYLPSLEHFMAEVLLRNEDVDYELLTGHWENLNPFSVEYLRHMLILVKGVIRGDRLLHPQARPLGRLLGCQHLLPLRCPQLREREVMYAKTLFPWRHSLTF